VIDSRIDEIQQQIQQVRVLPMSPVISTLR